MNKSNLESILSFENITLKIGNRILFKNLSFNINKSSFCLIQGANGVGKTTLARSMLGFIKPVEGVIKLNYKKPGYVPQFSSLDMQYPITLFELIMLGSTTQMFNKYTQKNKTILNLKKEKAWHLIQQLEIQNPTKILFRNASGGQLQKTLIAATLLTDPDFIILDEPFSNLDHNSFITVKNILHNLSLKQGVSICIIDHPYETHSINYNYHLSLEMDKVAVKRL